ncbi:AraC family transcriptional regulator [Tenacibaculum adriaticum]|uniref:AraC family transcriptional regulator n=1 Tax=Tenacibaculum adriaticum TaxID=413713 RepID=A0A5S5DRG8_9FLAO|nr:helix-turn-helix transcriptional regulator [Tenacibaculum adriaticum]TYP97978.1 AraC family transcriptional regulator [Tenacibaculum adriaticum]
MDSINIYINDGTPNAIIKSMAKELNVPINYISNNNAKLCLPENIGTGCIQQRFYKSGISVFEVKANLKQEINLLYDQGLLHPLKIIINKKARFKHQFHDKKEPEYLNEQGSVALASIARQKHTIFLPKNQYISLLSIRINRKEFESYVEDFVDVMSEKLSDLLRDVNGVNPYFYEDYYDHNTLSILNKYFQNNYEGITESIYLEGLIYQLIGIQFNTISSNSFLSADEKRLSRTFSENILRASKIVKSDVASFSTVTDLGNKVNLNNKRLQQGFNKLFGMSVLEFVTNYRIEKMRDLLLETDLTISEISYQLGINSPGYTSKIFKDKYGVSPKQYRKKS